MENILTFTIELFEKFMNLLNDLINFFLNPISILGFEIKPIDILFVSFGVFFIAWLIKKVTPLA